MWFVLELRSDEPIRPSWHDKGGAVAGSGVAKHLDVRCGRSISVPSASGIPTVGNCLYCFSMLVNVEVFYAATTFSTVDSWWQMK